MKRGQLGSGNGLLRLCSFLCLLLALWTSLAFSGAELRGTIVAKRGYSVQVEYRALPEASPLIGDEVKFTAMLAGIPANAGTGIISSVEGNTVWVKATQDNLKPSMQAVIYASGAASYAQSESVSSEEDDGWGSSEPRRIEPEDAYINRIMLANKACDHQLALRLADKARVQIPDSVWLDSNYATLQLLSQRSTVYQQAVNDAYISLEQGSVSKCVEFLKIAMQYASVPCSEDKQILSLLDLARQMAQMDRDDAIEAARARALHGGPDSDQYRARIAEKRVEREAFGNMLTGNLLVLLKKASSGDSSSDHNRSNAQDEDFVGKLVTESERNNKEILNKWRASQGWPEIPAQEAVKSKPQNGREGHSGAMGHSDDAEMHKLIDKMNDDETLKRWRETQRSSSKPSADGENETGW